MVGGGGPHLAAQSPVLCILPVKLAHLPVMPGRTDNLFCESQLLKPVVGRQAGRAEQARGGAEG